MIRWERFFEEEDKKELRERMRQQWYMAQTAYEIASLHWTLTQMFAKNPKGFKHKVKDYLVRFADEVEAENREKEAQLTPEEKEKRAKDKMNFSKSAWFGLTGVDTKLIGE